MDTIQFRILFSVWKIPYVFHKPYSFVQFVFRDFFSIIQKNKSRSILPAIKWLKKIPLSAF